METGPLHLETGGGVPIKAWTRGVPFDPRARLQVMKIAQMPFIHSHVAVMPDVHVGIGATVGSVIASRAAVIPAAVGVDIGCGMMAVRTSLSASDLPDDLRGVRSAIEGAVPVGNADHETHRRRRKTDHPTTHLEAWATLFPDYDRIRKKRRKVELRSPERQLGTLGGGNHFVEVCLDEADHVWVMLHSGSRGVGNGIGSVFIELARKDAERLERNLPDRDLAYFDEGTEHFDDYLEAVGWAQRYAAVNRDVMIGLVLGALRSVGLPAFTTDETAVNCHHNYVARERHFDVELVVTRKGAVSARDGELGIIPGSMGARSFIVRGKGNPASFTSCSHGAGRLMSRTEAKKRFSLDDHRAATEGVECRKDHDVIDETPGAYKSIDAVMAAQADLVDVVHTLKQIVCVKG